jgi:lysophospholipase L1-like esterase
MRETQTIVVTALGDSITSGAPLWDPNPAVRETLPGELDERSQWTHWAQAKDPRLVFRNHGVNMQETGEIASRLDAAVHGADVLIVQGGVNDLVHGQPLEGAAENLDVMVQRGQSFGLPVAIAELIPNNNFTELDEQIRELNERIRRIGEERSVPVLAFYAALEDPQRPSRIHPDWTDDGNHPNVAGHRRLGELGFLLPEQS